EATGAALAEFLAEFAHLRGGDLTAAEIEKARGARRASAVDTCSSLSALVEEAAALFEADLPFSTFAADLAALPGVTAEQANALAKEAIPLERGVLVLVGDAALIREQARAAGLPEPIQVDADGEEVR
ncbi:MAG: hypothetical protein HY812_08850, partial [Planctomycetes bacterium]|nr:hypothetical protein [Planctomycetota bacterium]